jgi:hypothetical protein
VTSIQLGSLLTKYHDSGRVFTPVSTTANNADAA